MLLEGRAHYYVYPTAGTKKWDTCAPEALLAEAGGVLTDALGTSLAYSADVDVVNRKGVLAALEPKKHSWAVSVVPEEVKTSLQS
jgi:3'(2'), 5'-bisphosphate nucleotidase